MRVSQRRLLRPLTPPTRRRTWRSLPQVRLSPLIGWPGAHRGGLSWGGRSCCSGPSRAHASPSLLLHPSGPQGFPRPPTQAPSPAAGGSPTSVPRPFPFHPSVSPAHRWAWRPRTDFAFGLVQVRAGPALPPFLGALPLSVSLPPVKAGNSALIC